MKKVTSHYESLKVARDAPAEVIRAAYRSLAQKYHPDRNAENAAAEQAMRAINDAYAVLSDPAKRREHDQWIRQMESGAAPGAGVRGATVARQGAAGDFDDGGGAASGLRRAMPWLFGAAALVMAVLLWPAGEAKRVPRADAALPAARPPARALPVQRADGAPAALPGYQRPAAAPNGRNWPRYADYVGGYPRLQSGGLSVVSLDNSTGDTDLFVKLVALEGLKPFPARWIYLPARGSFTLEQVAAGDYDIRLVNLDTGRHFRSEPFKLEETLTDAGVQFSRVSLPLSAPDGGTRLYDLAEAEF